MSHHRIRRATADDAAAVLRMARALAETVDDPPPELTEAEVARQISGPDPWAEALLALRGGEAIGYALFCRGFEAHTGQRRLWLADLFVDPAARANGVGRRLLAAVARRALELGCSAVCWDLWRDNAAGAAFYARLGAETADDLAQLRLTRERLARLAAERDV